MDGSSTAEEHGEGTLQKTFEIAPTLSTSATRSTAEAPPTSGDIAEVGSPEWLKKVRAALKQLQPPMSVKEKTLAEIADDIRARRDAKCLTKDIAALLTANNLEIDGPELTCYLRGAPKQHSGKTR